MALEWLTKAVAPGSGVPYEEVALRLGAGFVFGCVVSLTYRATVRNKGSAGTILPTLLLLSVLIALVTVVINDDIARAFSLVGALAIVRFRTVVEDTRDTAFVIYAVAVGMSAGLGYFVAPMLAAPLVALGAFVFQPRERAGRNEGLLVLRLAAGRPPEGAVRAALEKYVGGGRLTGLATARGGAALDATYAVDLPTAEAAVALLAELSRIEGVQGVELKGM
jgi:uncharacterized membrane protein YhiD involved in acid resistance